MGLFAGQGPQKPPFYTVSQVNQLAKQLLERQLGRVTVAGEVSNFKKVSGHCYVTLKDKGAQLAAVMFRREADALKFRLEDGMQVWASGRLTVYGPYGRYQMVIEHLEPQGAGALQAAFEELKKRLQQEGLFAAERKRPLPLIPRRVGVITSPTGAVIRDITHVAERRFPNAQLLVIPTRVQGAESAAAIVRAIERASSLASALHLDVLIVARGGGSLEDLWGFNDERVARAIAAAPVPVVSAVGHETDTTIADFVADKRAPTPSAAAELVFPVRSELLAMLRGLGARHGHSVRRRLQLDRHHLRALQAGLGDGRNLIRERFQGVSELLFAMQRAMRERIHRNARLLHGEERRLARLHPKARLLHVGNQVGRLKDRLRLLLCAKLQERRQRLASLGQRLHALSPLAVLDRGYAIVLTQQGQAVRRVRQLQVGAKINVRVAQGRFDATVTNLEGEQEK